MGWYSTGPRLREADPDINDLMTNYCDHPTLVICEVEPKEIGLPFTAYITKEEIKEDGTEKNRKVFISIPTEVGQTEAEEVGALFTVHAITTQHAFRHDLIEPRFKCL